MRVRGGEGGSGGEGVNKRWNSGRSPRPLHAPVKPSSRSSCLKRVVIRTSVGCVPPVKGWTDTCGSVGKGEHEVRCTPPHHCASCKLPAGHSPSQCHTSASSRHSAYPPPHTQPTRNMQPTHYMQDLTHGPPPPPPTTHTHTHTQSSAPQPLTSSRPFSRLKPMSSATCLRE